MKIKGVLKKKYPPNAGNLNKKPANRLVILKYATKMEREQYEKEIMYVKYIFEHEKTLRRSAEGLFYYRLRQFAAFYYVKALQTQEIFLSAKE